MPHPALAAPPNAPARPRVGLERSQRVHEQAKIFGAVRQRARARGVHIETNVPAPFRGPEMELPPSRFNIQPENVGIVELFHPGFCMSNATQAIIEWDGEVVQALRRSCFGRSYRANCAVGRDFYLGHP